LPDKHVIMEVPDVEKINKISREKITIKKKIIKIC